MFMLGDLDPSATVPNIVRLANPLDAVPDFELRWIGIVGHIFITVCVAIL